MLDAIDVVRAARKALETEIFTTTMYRYLAERYPDKNTGNSFSEAADMEAGHVRFWTDFLRARDVSTAGLKPNFLRVLLYRAMFRLLGRGITLRIMEIGESEDIKFYSGVLDHPGISQREREGLARVLEDELVHEKLLMSEESKFGGFIAHMKDAILGLNDGLVEILSVTTGLAGASGRPAFVAVSGLIVGTAGALSMGISTYTSSRSQRQVHEGILKRITIASKFAVRIFRERLSGFLERRGYSKRLASEVAEESSQDSRLLSSLIAEQEYGLREENLVNPLKASLYAGFANLLGALIPLLPYFFVSSISIALILSLVFTALALTVSGFFISVFAYMPPGMKIGEMLWSGLGSAAITYVIGRLASRLLGVSRI